MLSWLLLRKEDSSHEYSFRNFMPNWRRLLYRRLYQNVSTGAYKSGLWIHQSTWGNILLSVGVSLALAIVGIALII